MRQRTHAGTVPTDDAVKSPVVEELYDLHVNRRVAALVVQGLVHTPVTPNQVTLVSASLGALTGWFIAVGTPGSLGFAAICLLTSMVLDCVDGQLARQRGGGTRLGRMMDGIADYSTALAVHLGMWSYLAYTGVLFRDRLVDGWGLFAWMLLAGASMALHSGLFDFRKQWFLAHVAPAKTEIDPPDQLRREFANAESAWERIGLWLYLRYTLFQQRLVIESRPRFLADEAEREAFVRRTSPFLRAASWIGPTTHNVLIVLAIMAAPFFPQSFWWYLLTVTVPMNIAFVAMITWGRRLDASLAAERAQ